MANLHLNGQFMENLKINLEAKDFTKFSSNFNLLKIRNLLNYQETVGTHTKPIFYVFV